MKKILFRADAAPHIGIGDLMSLIHLSRYFDENWKTYFVIRNYPAAVALIDKYNVSQTHIIDADTTVGDEVTFLNDFIREHGIDIVFFEITERKLSDYQGLNPAVKKGCVNFDGHIPLDMDLVVDWDVEALKYFNPASYPATTFLLGPEHVILPKEFYSKRVLNRLNTLEHKTILIAMGGADELDFTGKVVDAIIRLGIQATLKVIIGSGYNQEQKLRQTLQSSGLEYTLLHNVTNMLDEYLSCDIGIGAGGLTSSEMVATKISPILIATYEHQVARCRFFHEQGWALYLGFREFSTIALGNAIRHPLKPSDEMMFQTYKIVEQINELFR